MCQEDTSGLFLMKGLIVAQGKVMNRWLVVIGAIVVQLCLGAIYAWSAFTKKLTDVPFSLTRTQTQVIFAVGLLTFAVVMALIAGKWQKKAGPRLVAVVGGIVLGLGYVIAGICGTSFWGILLGVGLLGGAGIGLAYVCPIAACVKWFPDKKGMITGFAVAGFGFGALIWIKLTSGFQFGPIDLTPGWKGLYGAGWTVSNVFILYGIVFAALVGIGSLVLVNPPEGWQPKGWQPDPAKVAGSGGADFTVRQMACTAQFWVLFGTFVVGALAGLMVIGVIALFGIDSLTSLGVEVAKATVIAGTAMGLFYALLNGLGRILWGALSDKTGRRNAIAMMSLTQGIMMVAFYFIGGNELGLYIGASIIGFNFGGNFALFPAATADLFGNKNVGVNYPWVFMAYGVGGVIGPILGGMMGDAKAWMWAFIPAGLACFVAAGFAMSLKPVQVKGSVA
ncbi:MAG TPA: OFA family MFS transporter [Sedimentisphaerales bacterium]|nr:OFA family MFS transporter [Sedimentisphaerales bacterium]